MGDLARSQSSGLGFEAELHRGVGMIHRVEHKGRLLAIIIPRDFSEPGIHFFTPREFSQQLAYMRHEKGKRIAPHVHNAVPRQVHYTQEVLLLRKGRLRVDFYDERRAYLESRVLTGGDTILLADGGHGFEVLEDVEMFEVKQGPYAGESDKTRFEPVSPDETDVPEPGGD
jgi:hypothetical protein